MDTNRIPKQALRYRQKKDEGTEDDRRRDGGTNSTLRIKEQETQLTLQEHDDYDDEYIFNFILLIQALNVFTPNCTVSILILLRPPLTEIFPTIFSQMSSRIKHE